MGLDPGTLKIIATHTRVGVNMGDHAQDVTNGIDVTADTTIGDLLPLLVEKLYGGDVELRDGDYITIRIAQPVNRR